MGAALALGVLIAGLSTPPLLGPAIVLALMLTGNVDGVSGGILFYLVAPLVAGSSRVCWPRSSTRRACREAMRDAKYAPVSG